MSERDGSTPRHLLARLRRLALAVGEIPLRWSEDAEPYEYLDASDLQARLREELPRLMLVAAAPDIQVTLVQWRGNEFLVRAEVEIVVSYVGSGAGSGESMTWRSSALADGPSAQQASAAAVTAARKQAWVAALSCAGRRSSPESLRSAAVVQAEEDEGGVVDLFRWRMNESVRAAKEGREAGVFEAGADPRQELLEALRERGWSTNLAEIDEKKFPACLHYLRTGEWPTDGEEA